ncbi:MAG: sulfatase [Deltaproteobacteria bacterium]|nr:sulfatase [Deltaproteobacteria bacterium]MBW2087173.1 sulfatase [Deltaproteobacteria bacterium]
MNNKPNIILLITHDTGEHISPYGITTVDTPNCERLAREAVLFENSFCTAPQCSPSRASLVTGRFPHTNGVMGLSHADLAWAFHEDEKPAAKLLASAGYDTWLLGMQHETRDPNTLGFDVVDLGFSILDLPEHMEPLLIGRDRTKPLYCQIGCFETHQPWDWEGTRPDSSKGITVPPYLPDTEEIRQELAKFQGNVKRFDQGLGQLLDLLEKHGFVDNTILMVTTDHGVSVPLAKATLYDPGIKTMLFMRYPKGGWPAGLRLSEMISNVDILPTLLEACQIDVPDNIHGRSFLGLLTGRDYEPNRYIFSEKTFHTRYDPMRSIRTNRFKYIQYFEKSSLIEIPAACVTWKGVRIMRRHWCELFDLEKDPNETKNLAQDPEYEATLVELRQRLARWMKETNDPLLDGPVASPFYYRSMQRLKDAL